MQDLNIALVQCSLEWEDSEGNIRQFEHRLNDVPTETDLVVLPEMFTTGFTMSPETVAEPVNGPRLQWMQQWSEKNKKAITGSIVVQDNGHYYNRMYFVHAGETHYYNKRHLFRMAGEHEHYSPGTERVIVSLNGWSILLQVCYDLRFPVWSRNRNDYDLALYVANWPAARSSAWTALLRARAIENYGYTAGVNRVGTDGKGIDYNGSSAVFDPKGECLGNLNDNQEGIIYTKLSGDELLRYREKFPVHLDADNFTIDF